MAEITGGSGVTFATGTPISNSMTEMFTLMRYLQYDTLAEMGLLHFDSWAATFGETVTSIELAPEGTGYRAKTRFARFFNLPELMSVFKETADVQTSDMLKLPVPEARYKDIVLDPSDEQKEMVASLGYRADEIRKGRVDPKEDNMLKVTTDGRKLALDQRLLDLSLPDDPYSKTNACVEKVYEIWEKGMQEKTTQLIFCDLSTPKGDGEYNVYDDIRNKLVKKGIPAEEISFIHEADTDVRKEALFSKVRSGQVRVLIGSTLKMGPGMNVQSRLIALHHLDVPWKPSDIEQQEGRIIRQGNMNNEVKIYRYVTKGTFDAYSWQILETKQKFISQIMTSKSPVRSVDDIDEAALSYAEVKALATGNPHIKEKMTLDIEVSKLRVLKSSYDSQHYRLEDDISVNYPKRIVATKELITAYTADAHMVSEKMPPDAEHFSMTVMGRTYTDKKEAGKAVMDACNGIGPVKQKEIGDYAGFKMIARYDMYFDDLSVTLHGHGSHKVSLGQDPSGNITRINNALEGIPRQLEKEKERLKTLEEQLERAKEEVLKPFPRAEELREKEARLTELNLLLDMDARGMGQERAGSENPVASRETEERDNEPVEEQESAETHSEDGYHNEGHYHLNGAAVIGAMAVAEQKLYGTEAEKKPSIMERLSQFQKEAAQASGMKEHVPVVGMPDRKKPAL